MKPPSYFDGSMEYTSSFEINLDGVKRNVERIQAFIGKEHALIGVVKGNAYGFGLERMAQLLVDECGLTILAVSHICEGARLRRAGIDCDILVMSAIPERLIGLAYEYDLQIPVFDARIAKALNAEGEKRNKSLRVHVKIETGMNRMGAKPGAELAETLEALKAAKRLEVVGTYTHFATARIYDNAFTKQQLARFNTGYKQLFDAGFRPKYVHAANSGAIMWLKESYFTHVRSASLMIGYARLKECENTNPLHVEEAAAWRTTVSNIYEVQPGETVGYARFFAPTKPTRIALAAVGSNDGVIRGVALGNGPVIVNGQKTHYVGACMDQCFIDVTNVDCEIGDLVTIFGADGEASVSPLELITFDPNMNCSQCFTNIGPRVMRRYIRDEGGDA